MMCHTVLQGGARDRGEGHGAPEARGIRGGRAAGVEGVDRMKEQTVKQTMKEQTKYIYLPLHLHM